MNLEMDYCSLQP